MQRTERDEEKKSKKKRGKLWKCRDAKRLVVPLIVFGLFIRSIGLNDKKKREKKEPSVICRRPALDTRIVNAPFLVRGMHAMHFVHSP